MQSLTKEVKHPQLIKNKEHADDEDAKIKTSEEGDAKLAAKAEIDLETNRQEKA